MIPADRRSFELSFYISALVQCFTQWPRSPLHNSRMVTESNVTRLQIRECTRYFKSTDGRDFDNFSGRSLRRYSASKEVSISFREVA
jgi:hypothetical protein